MSNLQLVKSKQFDGFILDCYIEPEQADSSAFWVTSEQIGLLLGYAEPDVAIRKIHMRNKERLDNFSTSTKLVRVEGERTVTREMRIYNFKGLLEICRYSNQPVANQVIDVLWEIADEIRRTGSYSVKQSAEDRELKLQELEIRQRELNLHAAEFLKDILNAPPFPLTDETRTVFGHELFRLAANKEYLAMLPECTDKWYTATELGKEFGISANKVGRIAKKFGLKAPEGESNEYGRWIFSKSQYSNREVSSFIYSEDAFDWFRDYQNGICKEV